MSAGSGAKRTAARKSIRRRGRQRLAVSLNTGVAVALAGLLLLMVNYLSFRHYRRADLSRTQYYTLSQKTRGLLGSLTNTVDVFVFLTPQSSVYEDVKNLLTEYEYASPRVKVEWVDPHRNLARTEDLARRFDVNLLEAGVIVFDYHGRNKYVSEDDMYERDLTGIARGEGIRPIAFKGERAFSSAIQSVTQSRRPRVYFLQGHRERNLESYDRFSGYSDLARAIERDNFEVDTVVLGATPSLPEDCDALVVAGPEKKLFQPEINLIAEYLKKGGRLLVMVDAAVGSGLGPFLAEWGVRLADDVVVDGSRTLTGRELFVTDYGSHPITRNFEGVTTVMYFPRSVAPLTETPPDTDPADQPRVSILAQSSAAGWAESDFDQNPMRFDPQLDEPGPVPVAVAVERGTGGGIDVEIAPSRLVVFGDSDFLANDAASGGNIDLFLSSLNWLVEREELMAIAPKPVEEMRLVMNERQLRWLFWCVVVGLPAAVAVLGGLVWMRRRS